MPSDRAKKATAAEKHTELRELHASRIKGHPVNSPRCSGWPCPSCRHQGPTSRIPHPGTGNPRRAACSGWPCPSCRHQGPTCCSCEMLYKTNTLIRLTISGWTNPRDSISNAYEQDDIPPPPALSGVKIPMGTSERVLPGTGGPTAVALPDSQSKEPLTPQATDKIIHLVLCDQPFTTSLAAWCSDGIPFQT